MLHLKKIYIDSRDRTVDSKSASNFKIELPYTVHMLENTVFFVTDVCIPHVWTTIEADFNDKLYMIYAYPPPSTPTTSRAQPTVVILDEGNYTLTQLATHLQAKLNNAFKTDAILVTTFIVTPNVSSNTLTISMTGTNSYVWFNMLTDTEVTATPRSYWDGLDPGNPSRLMTF